MKNILIPTSGGHKKVAESNIIRIQASSNYCKIIFNNDKPLVVAKVLHWFQGMLTEEHFYRIHRTHLVNRYHVTELLGGSRLRLSNGDLLTISRRKKSQFRELLKKGKTAA